MTRLADDSWFPSYLPITHMMTTRKITVVQDDLRGSPSYMLPSPIHTAIRNIQYTKFEKKMSYKPPMGDPSFLQKPIRKPTSSAVGAQQPRRSGSSSAASSVRGGVAGSEAKVYTGSSAPMRDLVRQSEPSIKKQPGELFHRVRPTTIGNMLDRVRIDEMQANGGATYLAGGAPEPLPGHEDLVGRRTAEVSSYNKTISDTIRPPSSIPAGNNKCSDGGVGRRVGGGGVNEVDPDPQQAPFSDREILILDVREKEDYDRCHLLGALHYPPIRLAHATNPFSLIEIRNFKNKPNHAIVLYDLDEEVTVQRKMANIFFEKGADNVYVMAGGLTAFVQTHAHLISGPSPVAVVAKSARLSAYGQDRMASTQRASSVGRGGGDGGGGNDSIAYGRRSGSTRGGATLSEVASSRLKGAFNRAAQPLSGGGELPPLPRAGVPPRAPQMAKAQETTTTTGGGNYYNAPSSSGVSVAGSTRTNDGNYSNCQGGRVPTPQRVQRLMQMAMTEDELARRGGNTGRQQPSDNHQRQDHHRGGTDGGEYEREYDDVSDDDGTPDMFANYQTTSYDQNGNQYVSRGGGGGPATGYASY